jgi:hypothetical protein
VNRRGRFALRLDKRSWYAKPIEREGVHTDAAKGVVLKFGDDVKATWEKIKEMSGW